MVQLKTFKQFISKENPVNEERLGDILENISEETKRVLADKFIPIAYEFGKFLTGESYDKSIKKGLIIRSHRSNIIKCVLKIANHEYFFDSYWINAKPLKPKDIYNALRDGNNQCIVFNDCAPSYLSSPECVAILKSVFSDKYNNDYCSRITFDSQETYVEDKYYRLNFRGIIIIICDETEDEISKELLDKFEFIDLTK
jgi:hypothetical protein